MAEPRVLFHGIDEAGYGPLLGPLVVARADLSMHAAEDEPRLRKGSPVAIADSKRLLQGRLGPARLEAAVLGCAEAIRGRRIRSLDDWLSFDGDPGRSGALADLPWYRGAPFELPFAADPEKVAAAREAFEKGKVFQNAEVSGFRIRVFSESVFNASVELTQNKHETLFREVATLLDEVITESSAARITIDRLGGRTFYSDKLSGAFPFVPIETELESRDESRYRMEFPESRPLVRFLVKGDDRALEVALASMMAKYTRELLMKVFNRYWATRVEGLRPTAGYYQDGQRFLADLERSGGVDPAELRRLARRR